MIDNNSFTYRPMRQGDLDAVIDIDRRSFSLPWPLSAYLHDLNDNSGALLWVAERHLPVSHTQVVGMIVIWLVADEAHIATLAVHPDYRRRGIGSKLLEVTIIEAIKRGAKHAMLEVRESNKVARYIYQEYGFKTVFRRPRYYRDNNEDALLMNLDNLEAFLNNRKLSVSQKRNQI
jgi:ribosomal-protein-alanine N-acetyltransferase